jgi:hypothetical protein
MISIKRVLTPITIAFFVSMLAFGFASPVIAGDMDMSDNSICMDCHEDADRDPPSDPNRPQVHNPDGGFFVESHADFSCIDCHTYITNDEHEDTAPGQEVDCLECHDEVPTKE